MQNLIRATKFLLGDLGLLCLGQKPWMWSNYQRGFQAFQGLEAGDPFRYMEQVEIGMARAANEAARETWRLNYGIGLSCLGRFAEAAGAIETSHRNLIRIFSDRELPLEFQAKIFVYWMHAALLGRDYELAVRIRDEGAFALAQDLPACKCIGAYWHYFFSDTERARRELMAIPHREGTATRGATRLYLVGRLDLAEGQWEAGMRKIEEAAQRAPKFWIAQEPKLLARHEERVDSPGNGARRLLQPCGV